MIPTNNEKHSILNSPNREEIDSLYNFYGDCDGFLSAVENRIKIAVEKKKEQVFFEYAPSLAVLEEAYGTNLLLRILSYQFIEVNASTNIKQKMDTSHIKELSRFFLSEYSNLKITEFLLFIRYLKNARWGSFFATVDPHLIKNWFQNSFLNEKKEVLKNHRQQIYQEAEQERKRQKELEREQWKKESVSRAEYEELKAKGLIKTRIQ